MERLTTSPARARPALPACARRFSSRNNWPARVADPAEAAGDGSDDRNRLRTADPLKVDSARGKSVSRNLATINDPYGSLFVAAPRSGSPFFHGVRSPETS